MGCIQSPQMVEIHVEKIETAITAITALNAEIDVVHTVDNIRNEIDTVINDVTTVTENVEHFKDIIDNKHIKYMSNYHASDIFWGIGIENESYLMTEKYDINSFLKLQEKRERYSQNYFNNFKPNLLRKAIDKIRKCNNMTYPIYINSHTFQHTDIYQNHDTFYDKYSTPNPKFTESIHEMLLKKSAFYKATYNKSIVFDGDSIEFITQQFYKTTVDTCVQELIHTKEQFLREISLILKWPVHFPDHNYGLVSFLSTYKRNLSLCNNGTYHINITMPTTIINGSIVDKDTFIKEHLVLVKCIQIVEPLLVACYGTPDIFSVLDDNYSVGSLRMTLSRYISLQTFDADKPINGKLLLMERDTDPTMWYNMNKAYELNSKIGYDINFNKFKNHGIELRIFDWFPEIYLSDLINFIILLAEHSKTTIHFDTSHYQHIIFGCVYRGFKYILTQDECNIILGDLTLSKVTCDMSAHALLTHISDTLYQMYHSGPIVTCMSPNMPRPELVNYNKIAFKQLHCDLFSDG